MPASPTRCTRLGPRANGRTLLDSSARNTANAAIRITAGFSGGGVWLDRERRFVGPVATEAGGVVAEMILARVLRAVWPALDPAATAPAVGPIPAICSVCWTVRPACATVPHARRRAAAARAASRSSSTATNATGTTASSRTCASPAHAAAARAGAPRGTELLAACSNPAAALEPDLGLDGLYAALVIALRAAAATGADANIARRGIAECGGGGPLLRYDIECDGTGTGRGRTAAAARGSICCSGSAAPAQAARRAACAARRRRPRWRRVAALLVKPASPGSCASRAWRASRSGRSARRTCDWLEFTVRPAARHRARELDALRLELSKNWLPQRSVRWTTPGCRQLLRFLATDGSAP